MDIQLYPVAVFGFNRPGKLSDLFDSLAKNPEFENSVVYVFIDGPRDDRDVADVEACRALCQAVARPHWQLRFSQANKGCRQAIYDGVSAILAENEAAIILEDDIVVSPVALAYFNEGLRRYAETARVWSICGYAYKASGGLNDENEAFFLPFSHPWGWATWKSRWAQFNLSEPRLPPDALRSVSFRKMFNVGGLIDAAALLDLEQRDLISCWDVRWYWRIFQAGGVSLFPSRGYTANTGIGGKGGTHSSGLSPYKLLLGKPLELNHRLPRWPRAVEINFPALDALITGPDASAQRAVASLGRLKRILSLA